MYVLKKIKLFLVIIISLLILSCSIHFPLDDENQYSKDNIYLSVLLSPKEVAAKTSKYSAYINLEFVNSGDNITDATITLNGINIDHYNNCYWLNDGPILSTGDKIVLIVKHPKLETIYEELSIPESPSFTIEPSLPEIGVAIPENGPKKYQINIDPKYVLPNYGYYIYSIERDYYAACSNYLTTQNFVWDDSYITNNEKIPYKINSFYVYSAIVKKVSGYSQADIVVIGLQAKQITNTNFKNGE